MQNIKKMVLTGGPCAGKTTALVRIIEHFSSLGYKVFTLPEVPTMFTQAGMDYLTQNRDFFYEGEKATLEMQLQLEDKFARLAQTITDQPVLIVCDRGTLDISAYLSPAQWQQITQAVGVTPSQLCEERYDAVLHLVSAADGAEQYYTTENNAQRNEPASEEGLRRARLLDKRVIEAWSSHPHLRVINNHDDFDTKINRVLMEISNVLGLPQPAVQERKYVVEVCGDMPATIDSVITQHYLVADPGTGVRLRSRLWVASGKTVYIHTMRKRTADGRVVETERQVDNALYSNLLAQADPYRRAIHKQRRSLIWKGQYFEIDTYQDELQGLCVLETKGIASGEEVNFPPFLRVVREVTGDKEYDNYYLALRK